MNSEKRPQQKIIFLPQMVDFPSFFINNNSYIKTA